MVFLADSLTADEMQRYQRHLQLPGFGVEAQQTLKMARVLLLGAGGLGCPIGLYLAAAGVGTVGVVDDDIVELSNLQRQVAHSTQGIGQPKSQSLIASMQALNPLVAYPEHRVRITSETIADLITPYDLIIDGTDNFSTRFLVADACYLLNKPLLSGAIYQFSAQLFLSIPGQTPCYRCLYRTPPKQENLSCTDAGVLGVLPGTVGLMMATEAIKHLTQLGETLAGHLLIYDALAPSLKKMALSVDQDCPLCGPSPQITKIQETQAQCQTSLNDQLSVFEAVKMIEQGVVLVDVREDFEYANGHLPNALSLPLSIFSPEAIAQLPTNQPLLVYCAKGSRSLKALELIKAWSPLQAYGLEGGIQAWQQQLGC